MIASTPEYLRRLRTPAYVVLGLSLLFAIADFLLAVTPLHPGTVMWRFGAVGLGANAVMTPLLLLVFIYALALSVEDRAVIGVICGLSALATIVLLAASGTFALDALQMKSRVQPGALDKFTSASAQAVVKLLLEAIACAVLAVSAFRANRRPRRDAARTPRPAGPLLGARPTPVPPERTQPAPGAPTKTR
jgi:hypothetical protein